MDTLQSPGRPARWSGGCVLANALDCIWVKILVNGLSPDGESGCGPFPDRLITLMGVIAWMLLSSVAQDQQQIGSKPLSVQLLTA